MDDEPVKTPPSADAPAPVPATIGPYRVDGPLGQGGMGEVHHGHDDRLDRPVALKRVRARGHVSDTVRERFRREARALARVRHPCVVEVYDWIEGAAGDWLVMELVEGESLQARLRRERVPLRQALEIGRDVAAGLAAVHAEGIVHRDVKPDNVMVMPPEGRVKLLDFGLAKRVEPVDGATLGDTLSATGQILGTVRFMSPEQASGRPVDQRSDCFSLGVLLYEMLTGVAPFRGDNTVETLTRICTIHETPIRDLEPDLPIEVAERVHGLLVKEPERRTASASEIAADLDRMLRTLDSTSIVRPAAVETSYDGLADVPTVDSDGGLSDRSRPEVQPERRASVSPPSRRSAMPALRIIVLASIGAGVWWWATDHRPTDPIYVAVPPAVFVGETGEAAERRLDAAAIEDGILRALLDLDGLIAVEPSGEDIVSQRPRALARATGATEVVTSELTCDLRSCRVALKRLGGEDGGIVWAGWFVFRDESLFEISRGIADQMRSAFSELAASPGVSAPRVTPEDYQRLLELRQALADPVVSADEAFDPEAEFEAIRASSPEFSELYRIAAGYWSERFHEARRLPDLERAREMIRIGRQLAPEDPRILRTAVAVHLVGGDLDSARRDVEALGSIEPGDADVLWLEARVLLAEGQTETARAMMVEAARRRPSWRYYANLAMVAREDGRLDDAMGYVAAMLERAPDSFYTLSLAAEFELQAGSVARAAELYEQLVRRRREPTELANLGLAYSLLGRYREAAELYAEVVDATPDSAYYLINLADARLLLGDVDATDLYRQVLAHIAADPDPQALLSVRAQALARLGEPVDAVEAIHGALQRFPNDPYIAFEAAVVYAVVGEEASALLQARRAFDAGLPPIWFDYPWFDGMREDLERLFEGRRGRR
ncbi:MAG: protein kinase [Acidobacteriota bacterium]